MSVVYDSVVPMSIISKGCTGSKQRGDWHNLQMKEGHIVSEKVSETIHISIKKEIGKLHIQLQNPQYVPEDEILPESETNSGSATKRDKKFNGLTLVIQKTRGVYFNAKILNLDDSVLEQTVRGSYILLVKVSVDEFKVQIL